MTYSTSSGQAETRPCQNCKQNFTVEPEDFDFYKKMDVPAPTWCPHCRLVRRFSWRNERHLFRRKNAVDGKEIFSLYPPEAGLITYDLPYWRSDAWDASTYGREYDFSKSFFEQFKELLSAVPWPAGSVQDAVNSEYSNQAGYLKNSYLVFNADYVEDSAYAVAVNYLKDCFDVTNATRAELCYDSVLLANGFKNFYSVNCLDSNDIVLSRDLIGCTNCVGCAGLRKKSYCIFNKQYSKEEYFDEVKRLKLDTHSGLMAATNRARAVWMSVPVKFYRGRNLVDSVAENSLNSKNVHDCWGVHEAQDLKYCQDAVRGVADSYDYSVWGVSAAQIYECLGCGDEVNNLKFCFDCWPASKQLEYSAFCRSSSDLFGCVSMKKKQYCILNKQYTKEEYEALIPRIKKHMMEFPYIDSQKREYRYGEFFPTDLSPFAYNETELQDLFPKAKEEALAAGFVWREQPNRSFSITMKASELPDAIDDATEEILKQIIECAECKKAYRIIPTELQFLRNQHLPLPRQCSECRYQKRHGFRNPPVFYDRQCAKCNASIRTTYAPNRPEIVYCESCYNAEMV